MILKDLHVHTNYCDGLNTPKELVEEAIKLNINTLGLLVHSYTFFDESYCVKKTDVEKFKEEISALKKEYQGKIELLCGVEQDYYSNESTGGFDYVIGSVHYLLKNGEYFAIDENVEILKNAVIRHYGGEFYALVEDYYKTVANVTDKTKCDIIGHFDLIKKFNKNGSLFSENDDRYINAYKNAVDKLVESKKPFEINTGGIYRGLTREPYPSKSVREYIKNKGGTFVLSSDAHEKNALLFGFNKEY